MNNSQVLLLNVSQYNVDWRKYLNLGWVQVWAGHGEGPRAGEHCGAGHSETSHTLHPEGSQLYEGSRGPPPSQESQGQSYIR